MSDKPLALVVDDVAVNASILSAALRDEFDVRIAGSGTAALSIAIAEAPSVILLDVLMPGLDGFEVCRQLKQRPNTRLIPVIFVTALEDVGSQEKGFEAGGVDFITKPISPATVLARARAQVAIYHQMKALARMYRDKTKQLAAQGNAHGNSASAPLGNSTDPLEAELMTSLRVLMTRDPVRLVAVLKSLEAAGEAVWDRCLDTLARPNT